MVQKNLKRTISKPTDKEVVKSVKLPTSTNNEEWMQSNLFQLRLILSYLNQQDIIQLSSVCKSLRSRLEPNIFQKIKLFPDNYLSNPMQYGIKSNKRGIQAIFLDRVIKTLGAKSHLVKEMEIKDDINSKYAKKFFSTFSNIRSLTIESLNIKINILLDILKPLELLENLHINSDLYPRNSNSSTLISDYRLPKTIQTMKIKRHSYHLSQLDSILVIDETYINLRSFTATNSGMLNQLKICHPSIVDLEIKYINFSDEPLIVDVILNNPQLKSLTIPGHVMSEKALNTILAHNHILTIKQKGSNCFHQHKYTNLVNNNTVTTIEFMNYFHSEFDIVGLNNFKKLLILKFSGRSEILEYADWKNYHGSLTQIELDSFSVYDINFDKFIDCQSLKKITINNVNNNDKWYHLFLTKLIKLKHWQANIGDQIILNRFN